MKKFLATIALVAVGLVLSLAYPVIAQTSNPMPTRPMPAQVSPAVPTAPTPSTQLDPIDRAFFMDAGQAAIGNIMIGQIALQRGISSDVKAFAQAEIDEQTQNKTDMTRIAELLRMAPPSDPAPKHQAAMEKLSQLSGSEFDQAYLAEAGVNAHLENASVFQREVAFGRNPDMVALANRGLPIINRHFTVASELTNYQFAQVARTFNGTPSAARSLEMSAPIMSPMQPETVR